MTQAEAEQYWLMYAGHAPKRLRAIAVSLSVPILRTFPAAQLAPPVDSGYTSVWLDRNVIASIHPKSLVTGLGLRVPLDRAEQLIRQGLDITIEDPDRRGAAWIQTSAPQRLPVDEAVDLVTEAMETERRASLERARSDWADGELDQDEAAAYLATAQQLDDEEGDGFDGSGRSWRRKEQGHLRRALLNGRGHAPCAFCGEVLPEDLLWVAHIYPRRFLTPQERGDLANVAVLACRLGCDPLFEAGYIAVGDTSCIVTAASTGIPAVDDRLIGLRGRQVRSLRPASAAYFRRHLAERFRG